MNSHLEITVDLFLDNKSEIRIDLVSFDGLDVVTVDRIRDAALFLESDKNGLGPIVLLILVAEELSIDLDMNKREITCVLWGESHWVTVLDFIFWWRLPVFGLRERYLQLIVNLCFDQECLGIIRSISKFKLDLVKFPWHSQNIGENDLNNSAVFQQLDVVRDIGSLV